MEIKKIKKLTTAESAYIAGLIDGEGTITMTVKEKGAQRQLVVSISNTEYELLQFVLDTVGAGKITSKKRASVVHKSGFAYVISNRQALDLLVRVTPYLRSYKKFRAKLILDNYVRLTPRNGKYTKVMLAERDKFIESFFSTKFSMRKQGLKI